MSLITLNVNYKNYYVDVAPGESLLEVLRNKLRVDGATQYCNTGVCGNCSVLLNGVSRQVCRILATEANQANIVTLHGNAFNASQPIEEVECSGLCLTL